MIKIDDLISFDIRHSMFRNATRFIDYELIEGDIFEFGVYTGRSLALLSYYHQINKKSIHTIPFERKVVGFDSFEGLPSSDNHPRWKKNLFSINHSYHPLVKKGVKVNEHIIIDLFKQYNLPKPYIEIGKFNESLKNVIDKKYKKAAIIHIDCDLYESTKSVLFNVRPILQEGTILLFDDWFNFKGNKNKGEQRAFYEFFKKEKKWKYIEYQTYATFGKSFIVTNNIS